MHLRISLIIVLLASVSAVAITHFVLRPKMNALIETRERLTDERDQQKVRADKLNAQFDDVSRKLIQNEAQLRTAIAQLDTAQAETAVLRERNIHMNRSLDQANNELTSARRQLAQLAVLGLTPEQAAGLFKSNQVLVSQVASLEREQDQLVQHYRLLKSQWDWIFKDSEFVPKLPPVSGRVAAVDPKWQFVVLDIGAEHGLAPRGVLMIARGGKLLAKAKLTRVDANRSVADLLPGWSFAEVQEGDEVFN